MQLVVCLRGKSWNLTTRRVLHELKKEKTSLSELIFVLFIPEGQAASTRREPFPGEISRWQRVHAGSSRGSSLGSFPWRDPIRVLFLKAGEGGKSSDVNYISSPCSWSRTQHLHLVLLMLAMHSAMSEFLFSVDFRAVISDCMTSMRALSCDTMHLLYSTNWHSKLHLGGILGRNCSLSSNSPFPVKCVLSSHFCRSWKSTLCFVLRLIPDLI